MIRLSVAGLNFGNKEEEHIPLTHLATRYTVLLMVRGGPYPRVTCAADGIDLAPGIGARRAARPAALEFGLAYVLRLVASAVDKL